MSRAVLGLFAAPRLNMREDYGKVRRVQRRLATLTAPRHRTPYRQESFTDGGAPIPVPLVRLGAIRPLHAMTVHRSQGSQFARITVLLVGFGTVWSPFATCTIKCSGA